MEDFGKLLSGMRSKASLKDKIRIAVDRLLHMDDGLTVEDKYELESCKLLTYENLLYGRRRMRLQILRVLCFVDLRV